MWNIHKVVIVLFYCGYHSSWYDSWYYIYYLTYSRREIRLFFSDKNIWPSPQLWNVLWKVLLGTYGWCTLRVALTKIIPLRDSRVFSPGHIHRSRINNVKIKLCAQMKYIQFLLWSTLFGLRVHCLHQRYVVQCHYNAFNFLWNTLPNEPW